MSNGDGQNWAKRQEANLFGIHRVANNGALLEREYGTINMVSPLRGTENTPDDRFDLSIDPLALVATVLTNDTVWVDPVNGNDSTALPNEMTRPYATLSAANIAANGLAPSATNPVLISLRPGVHETAPLLLQTYVTIAGVDGCETAIIKASTTTDPLITGADGAVIKNVTLQGANGAGGIGVLMATTGSMRAENCCVKDCTIGARSSGVNAQLNLRECEFLKGAGEAMDRGVEAIGGGQALADACVARGSVGDLMGQAFVANGAGSVLELNFTLAAYAVSGVYAENGGVIRGQGSQSRFCTNGIHIATTNGAINLAVGSSFQSTSEDVLVEGAASFFAVADLGHERPLSITPSAQFFGTRFTLERFVVEGDASIGSVGRPAGAAIGSGTDHIVGLVALQEDPASPGVYVDVTDAIVSPSGSVTPVFSIGTVGAALYIGGTLPFTGIYADTTLLTTNDSIVIDQWDGALWNQADSWMVTQATSPYASKGDELFRTAEEERIWLDVPPSILQTIDGKSRYWMRFRVDTTPLSIIPQVEHMRLDVSSTVIQSDGQLEHRGAGEYVDLLPGGDEPVITWEPSGTPAPTTALLVIDGQITYSIYLFGAAGARQINRAITVPPGIDTSKPTRVELVWDPGSSTAAGNVEWTVYHSTFKSTDVVNGLVPQLGPTSVVSAAPGVAYQGVEAVAELWIPGVKSGHETLAIEVQRNGGVGADTFPATARLRAIRVLGTYRAPGEQA